MLHWDIFSSLLVKYRHFYSHTARSLRKWLMLQFNLSHKMVAKVFRFKCVFPHHPVHLFFLAKKTSYIKTIGRFWIFCVQMQKLIVLYIFLQGPQECVVSSVYYSSGSQTERCRKYLETRVQFLVGHRLGDLAGQATITLPVRGHGQRWVKQYSLLCCMFWQKNKYVAIRRAFLSVENSKRCISSLQRGHDMALILLCARWMT